VPTVTTDELIAAAAPKLAAMGGAFYFAPKTLAVGKEHGLDGFRFYFLGRGGVMGDVEPAVVVSALGYFNPALVDRMWTTGRTKLAPPAAATAYLECCHQFGRDHVSKVGDLDVFCSAAEAIVEAVDPAGLTVYAGIAAAPLPDDLPARTMQLIAVLRELRGSAHLVAVRASGLTAEIAHYLRRPDDYSSFGWGDTPPAVTDDDRARLASAETLTDDLVRPSFSVVDAKSADTVVKVLTDIEAALAS
jgi:helix-turn-helix protein